MDTFGNLYYPIQDSNEPPFYITCGLCSATWLHAWNLRGNPPPPYANCGEPKTDMKKLGSVHRLNTPAALDRRIWVMDLLWPEK